MDDTPKVTPLLLELIDRLIRLETERNAALGFLLDCRDGQGKKVDWPSHIQKLTDNPADPLAIAGKYEPLKEYLREFAPDHLVALSRLVSIPVSQVDNPLWKPSK